MSLIVDMMASRVPAAIDGVTLAWLVILRHYGRICLCARSDESGKDSHSSIMHSVQCAQKGSGAVAAVAAPVHYY